MIFLSQFIESASSFCSFLYIILDKSKANLINFPLWDILSFLLKVFTDHKFY